jgi:hypothetical protein
MFKSKKVALLLLAIASMMLSRLFFVFVNDPEGPNLLIVTVLAAIIFFVSLGLYFALRFFLGFFWPAAKVD